MLCGVPLYFQIAQSMSPSDAGLRLVPSVAGNTIGGLATGAYIKYTGRYKWPMVISSLNGIAAYLLMAGRWTGHTGILEVLYIVPGGFATGVAWSSMFVALRVRSTEEELAIVASGL